LESEPFVVDRNGLELRLGGGATGLTRVELRVGGTLVNQATGTGNNFMKKVLFNVSAYVGRTAQIVLIDDDPYGHVLADHICLVDAPAGKTDG
jgi:hypothetical protein